MLFQLIKIQEYSGLVGLRVKTLQAQGIEWGEDYRRAGALALKDVLEGRMAAGVDRHLDEMAERGAADRRNGSYRRWLMTELGEMLSVPRTRSWSALAVVRAYARRAAHIDRMILACFVLGLSTRKVAIALLPILGRRISAGRSQVAKNPPPALCSTAHGKKEIIDCRLAVAESAREWELFLTDRRAARDDPSTAARASWPPCRWSIPASPFSAAGRTRSETSSARSKRLTARPPKPVHERPNRPRGTVRRPPLRGPLARHLPPDCLRNNLDELLTCWRYPTLDERKRVRTTNVNGDSEKCGDGPGPWAPRSWAVFTHENSNQGCSDTNLLTLASFRMTLRLWGVLT